MNIDDTLWCIHILGPDEMFAQPSHDVAVKTAWRHNEWLFAKAGCWTENDPSPEAMRARVVPWPWSAKSHADELAREGLRRAH